MSPICCNTKHKPLTLLRCGAHKTKHRATNVIVHRFESDREDGGLDALSPGDRHLAFNDLGKDGKASREQARIAAKFAALYPVDDLEVCCCCTFLSIPHLHNLDT